MIVKAVKWICLRLVCYMINQSFQWQVEDFKKFASNPDVYERICSKIAPSIYGHKDMKKALCCLLFGGSRKVDTLTFEVWPHLLNHLILVNQLFFQSAEFARWSEVKRRHQRAAFR